MSTCENLTFVDPQAELRARYLAAWRAHLKACAGRQGFEEFRRLERRQGAFEPHQVKIVIEGGAVHRENPLRLVDICRSSYQISRRRCLRDLGPFRNFSC